MLNVVNERQQLVDTISLGALTRHVFSQDREPTVHARSLIGAISRETAGVIMRTRLISATVEEEIGVVTRRMLEANVEEISVVDADARVIADITIVDLLQHLLVSDAAAETSGGSNEPSPHDGP
jgi:CBS-domain-containing membrane protein